VAGSLLTGCADAVEATAAAGSNGVEGAAAAGLSGGGPSWQASAGAARRGGGSVVVGGGGFGTGGSDPTDGRQHRRPKGASGTVFLRRSGGASPATGVEQWHPLISGLVAPPRLS